MDVKDFVSSTILQIMEGVSEAQGPARALGEYVNPTAHRLPESGAHAGVTPKGHAIYAVDFDLAVVVATEGEIGAGAKLQVASIISIGGSGRAPTSIRQRAG